MHLKCSEIVWIQKWKERLSRFWRRFFLTEHDLIEFIQQFEKFKDEHRTLINGFIMQAVCKSEFDQKIERLDNDRMAIQVEIGDLSDKLYETRVKCRLLKGIQTKHKKSIDQLRDITSEFEMYIKEWDKERSDIEGILGEQEKVQKKSNEMIEQLKRNCETNFQDVSIANAKINTLKDVYDVAYYLQESMDKLAKAHGEALKEVDIAMRKSIDQRSKLDRIADQYRSAVDAQAKGHIASMQGIVRELERKNK